MTAGRPREAFVDALRGFALLGIVLVNAPFLALSPEGYTAASLATPLDRAAAFFTVAFAQAKFYLLFAFLFGYSLKFLLDRDDVPQRRRYLRRLGGLGLLGALHAVLAFVGDILLLYALVGTSLLALVRWRDVTLLRFAGALLLAWWALLAALALALAAWDAGADAAVAPSPAFAALGDALLGAGFAATAAARARAWPETFAFIALMNGPAVWAMFALGLVAGRRRWLSDLPAHRGAWRRTAVVGWAIGLPIALWSAWMSVGDGAPPLADRDAVRATLLGFASAPFLAAAYVASLLALHRRAPGALAPFRPAGRMSLTGYLGESIVLSLAFSAYGAGLHGALGAAATLAAGAATWLALDLAARAWLARFAQGPFEALLARISGRNIARTR